MITLAIILTIIIIFLSITLFYALKRINEYENVLLQFQQTIEYANQKMKQVDANGHYESDDETGFFFEQLKSLQEILSDIFIQEEEKDGQKKD